MFLGKMEPKPTELWPDPKWCPELRLRLALWLEEKGDNAGAKAVAEPALDPRYGLSNFQPALKALLARIS
jgi:hypothetical protein